MIPSRLAARFDHDRRSSLVIDLLRDPSLDVLLAPSVPFARAPDLYAALDADTDGAACPVFVYP